MAMNFVELTQADVGELSLERTRDYAARGRHGSSDRDVL
jgi:hypothetical protein